MKLNQGRFRLDMSKNLFYNKGDEVLEEVAERGGKCPISRNVPGQIGWGSELPDLFEDVAVYFGGVG